MAEPSGFWAMAAVPGWGIRRVWVDTSGEPINLARQWADEHQREQWGLRELMSGQRDDGHPSVSRSQPEPPSPPSGDPGESFLNFFGERK